ncbi:MAG: ATP-binding cassette domain-containing protein [Chloroflexi bacterium]|nr:ATP-binding cassette domain-containing protein [Chloroflexota bacterium]
MEQSRPLLEVRNLQVHFPVTRGFILQRRIGSIKAVDGVNFSINPGETLGLVGESGSGKTTTGRAILQLTRPTGGEILFDGHDLVNLNGSELRKMRRSIGVVFQDPYGALNPRATAGQIVGAPLVVHKLHESKAEYRKHVESLFETVGLNRSMTRRYPHEFSGGQRQRLGVARALAARPRLVILDEPVSSLDVSIQAQIINLLQDLQARFKLSYLFIAHDLSVVRHISNRVAVMYLGKIVETADRNELYRNPLHPYTKALLSAAPVPDPIVERKSARIVLKGDIPSPLNPPSGCVFHTRCPIAVPECSQTVPELRQFGPLHAAACIRVPGYGDARPDSSGEKHV